MEMKLNIYFSLRIVSIDFVVCTGGEQLDNNVV